MSKKVAVLFLVTAILLVFKMSAFGAPPSRPLDVTPSQFEHICYLETQPEHAAILEVHAAYKTDREKNMDITIFTNEVTGALYNVGFPVAVLLLAIAGA